MLVVAACIATNKCIQASISTMSAAQNTTAARTTTSVASTTASATTVEDVDSIAHVKEYDDHGYTVYRGWASPADTAASTIQALTTALIRPMNTLVS